MARALGAECFYGGLRAAGFTSQRALFNM